MKLKKRYWVEIVCGSILILLLLMFSLPRFFKAQTRSDLAKIKDNVDEIARYFNERKEIFLFQYPEYETSVDGMGTVSEDGTFNVLLPKHYTGYVLVDDVVMKHHFPTMKIPAWDHSNVSYTIVYSSLISIKKKLKPSDIIDISVYAHIRGSIHSSFVFYWLDLDENMDVVPNVDIPTFDLTNGLKSEGIIKRSSYDLGYRINSKDLQR